MAQRRVSLCQDRFAASSCVSAAANTIVNANANAIAVLVAVAACLHRSDADADADADADVCFARYTTTTQQYPSYRTTFRRRPGLTNSLTALFVIAICFSSLKLAATAPSRRPQPASVATPALARVQVGNVRRRVRVATTAPPTRRSSALPRFSPRPSVRESFHFAFENACSKRFMVANTSIGVRAIANISQSWFGPYDWREPPSTVQLTTGGKHICFNKRSRLVLQEAASFDYCNFIVQKLASPADNVVLKLASRPEWAVGFKKNGEPFFGKNYARRRTAVSSWSPAAKEPECFVFRLVVSGKAAAAKLFSRANLPDQAKIRQKQALNNIGFTPRNVAQNRATAVHIG